MAQCHVHHLLLVTLGSRFQEEFSTREIVNFQRITFDEFPVLEEDVVCGLNWDQKLLYRLLSSSYFRNLSSRRGITWTRSSVSLKMADPVGKDSPLDTCAPPTPATNSSVWLLSLWNSVLQCGLLSNAYQILEMAPNMPLEPYSSWRNWHPQKAKLQGRHLNAAPFSLTPNGFCLQWWADSDAEVCSQAVHVIQKLRKETER